MIELSTHIEYMLLGHNRVSVPQLGTFIAREMSSSRSDDEGIFLPPYRTLDFHWNGQEEGDEFLTSLARLHNMSRAEARIMCSQYVDELMETLQEEGTVSFGSMGSMICDPESGWIGFVPLQSGIASPSYYGLDVVSFAKLSHEVRQQRAKRQAAGKTKLTSIQADRDTITIRINRKAFNYTTAVAASIALFFAVTSPLGKSITTGVSQKAGFFLATKLLQSAKPVPNTIEAQPVAEPGQKAEGTTIEELTSEDYAIVLACSVGKKNALDYADKLQEQGYNALACEFRGKVSVIIPGFKTEDEACEKIRLMKKSSSQFAGIWSCKVEENVKPIEK